MTSKQRLRLHLSDLNHPKRVRYVEHVYEGRTRPGRVRKAHHRVNKRKQPNIALELTVVLWVAMAGAVIAVLV